jgi:DNA-binding transcriptional LysR family regulator
MSVYDYLEFKHLKSIVAIAEEGTITAAATRIPLAQSALSRQINELEEALHIQIFERDRGGIRFTPAGESLLRFARELLQTRKDVVKAVQTIHQATMRPFRLGMSVLPIRSVLSVAGSGLRSILNAGSSQTKTATHDQVYQITANIFTADPV